MNSSAKKTNLREDVIFMQRFFLASYLSVLNTTLKSETKGFGRVKKKRIKRIRLIRLIRLIPNTLNTLNTLNTPNESFVCRTQCSYMSQNNITFRQKNKLWRQLSTRILIHRKQIDPLF